VVSSGACRHARRRRTRAEAAVSRLAAAGRRPPRGGVAVAVDTLLFELVLGLAAKAFGEERMAGG
jgi:hypothetical protein